MGLPLFGLRYNHIEIGHQEGALAYIKVKIHTNNSNNILYCWSNHITPLISS